MMKSGSAILFYLASLAFSIGARAEIQFDVFPGYDNIVREAGWFPIACEIFNDGPSFNGVVEISSGAVRSDQIRRIPIELPTNTRKRFSIPMFATGGRFFQWNTRLLDDRGKVRAERSTMQPKVMAWEGVLIGALPRTFAGMPTLPDLRRNRPELKPQVARMTVEQFPDNPIALEGLDAVYLNSERALGLSIDQVEALLAWIHGGGHLIASVEQLGDVNATPWLQQLLPATLKEMVGIPIDKEVQEWLKTVSSNPSGNGRRTSQFGRQSRSLGSNPYANLQVDQELASAEIPVATGTIRDGKVILAASGKPLILQAQRGRGQITLLTFNPEREPFRSWKNREWFWAKIAGIPGEWFLTEEVRSYGGWSIDGVFGALIDSRQVRKLPVQWLLLLLIVYLVVIGPFDQYVLKRIGRQMLTWITFPAYVVLFSLLIYFIGYKLRAGETEWNELHVVDILPRGAGKAELRGRTYASIYSSSNAKYSLGFTPPSEELADRTHATLRGELLELYGSGREASRATIEHYGNTFRAEVFVPVWTSLLYVNDWLQPAPAPLTASFSRKANDWLLTIENRLDRPLPTARVVIGGSVYDLGTLAARERKEFSLVAGKGIPLESFIQQNGARFQDAVNQRRNPTGDTLRGWIDQPELHSMVASFASHLPGQQNQRNCVTPAGLDLTPLVESGNAVILAWDPDHSFANPINQFKPLRTQRNTLLRLVIPSNATAEN
ncbi:MAG: hypothetical protein O2960_21600 [Verrucomicrobia bacterium]|nr:hypothetical protein [Verrucomicrobiota bacterium]